MDKKNNTGNYNSGHWNSGYFNTNSPDKIRFFNTTSQAVEDTRLQQITELLARREDIINSTEKVYIEIHLKGDSISISTQVFDNN